MLRGERTGRKFSIGLPVKVQIVDVSLQRFEVTLAILPEERVDGEADVIPARRGRGRDASDGGRSASKGTSKGTSRDTSGGPSRGGRRGTERRGDERGGKCQDGRGKKASGQGRVRGQRKGMAGQGQNDDATISSGRLSTEGGKPSFKKPQPPKTSGRKTRKKNIASKQKKKR